MFSCCRLPYVLGIPLVISSLLNMPMWAISPVVSETELRERIARFPKEAGPYETLAQLLLERLRKDWARQDYSSLSGASFQSQIENFQRRAQEILSLYRKIEEFKPKQVEILLQMAEIHYLYLGQTQQAQQLLEKASRLAPEHPQVIIALADFTFYHHGKRHEALEQLRKALQKHPHQPDVLITLADLLSTPPAESRDYIEAKTLLHQALEIQPQAQNLRLMLGQVWVREATRDEFNPDKASLKQALQLFQTVTTMDPQNETAWLEMAKTAQQLGQYTVAEQALRTLLKQFPNHIQGRLLLGDNLLIQASKDLDQGLYTAQAAEADQWYESLLPVLQEIPLSQQVQLFYNQGLLAVVHGQVLSLQSNSHHQAEQRLRAAIAAFEKAQHIFDQISIINASLQKDLAKAWHYLGLLLWQNPSRQTEAISCLETACSLNYADSCTWLKQQR